MAKKEIQMNYLTTSKGERIPRSTFDYRIKKAKRQKLQEQFDEHGFNFCVKCEKNSCIPIDVSHIISVDKCIKEGYPELAYSIHNMQIYGRKCHKEYDGLDLKFTNN